MVGRAGPTDLGHVAGGKSRRQVWYPMRKSPGGWDYGKMLELGDPRKKFEPLHYQLSEPAGREQRGNMGI